MTVASMSEHRCSVRAVARTLRRVPSTFCRVLLSDSTSSKGNRSQAAQQACQVRRCAAKPESKRDVDCLIWLRALTLLDWLWLPLQFSGTLKCERFNDPKRHVSHEAIYTPIYALTQGEAHRQLVACLCCGHSNRTPRACAVRQRGQTPKMISIYVSPLEIENHEMYERREGDFIKGAGNLFSVGVLVDRSSCLVRLSMMGDAIVATASAGLAVKLNSFAKSLRQSLNNAQNKKMIRRDGLREQTGVNFYICDPYSSWQICICRGTNGLPQPKGANLNIHFQEDIDAIADTFHNQQRAAHELNSLLAGFAAHAGTSSTGIQPD